MFAASAFMAPCEKTMASLLVSAWNLLASVLKTSPVSALTRSATSTSKPAGAFSPVPTAVPPNARRRSMGRLAASCSREASSMPRQPEISWLNAMGTASCRWVRPLFTTPAFWRSRRSNVATSWSIAGMSSRVTASTAAMCMAVGKVSFEDCERLTESLGCTGPSSATPSAAAIWFARFARTSFTFMFDCVPEPVCHTLSGNWSSCLPERTSSAARSMRSAALGSRVPSWAFACAAAFLRMANARTMPWGMVSVPMGKFW